MLNDVFTGKSVNTPGFLIAVLLQEKLLVPMRGKKRSHEAADPGGDNGVGGTAGSGARRVEQGAR